MAGRAVQHSQKLADREGEGALAMTGTETYLRLVPDTAEASRFTNASVAAYVGSEERGSAEAYSADDVSFIRSAACDGFNVWLWSCRSEQGDVYVYAFAEARRFGPACLVSDFQPTSSMTPEAYLRYLGYWPTRRKVKPLQTGRRA